MVLGCVVPLGIVLGMPLPSMIRLMTARGLREGIPTVWGANGLASVLGTAGALGIGINLGFSATVYASCFFYLIAAFVMVRLRQDGQA